jgi:hypothetical protein
MCTQKIELINILGQHNRFECRSRKLTIIGDYKISLSKMDRTNRQQNR